MTSPPMLVTAGNHQYTAYYNAERRLTLAWRMLDEHTWQHRHFPVVTTWAIGGHALIALAVDADGMIHLLQFLGFDSQQRPVASYHKYALCGFSAIDNARFEDGEWKRFIAFAFDSRLL